MRNWAMFLLAALGLIAPAVANVHEAHIPLHHHRLETAELSAALLEKLHLPGVGFGSGFVDLSGLQGSDFINAFNAALGDGGHVEIDDGQLLLRIDPQKLPANYTALRRAVRVFTEVAAPEATANQRRLYGLFMPQAVDPKRPMVVLIQGLDCGRSNSAALGSLLEDRGYQAAYFSYPSDGPIEDSAELLAKNMAAVREVFPTMPLDIVGHSLGGLIARRYVEGDEYAGGVKHLILVGTPNSGTRWATFRIALEAVEHYRLWRGQPDWRPSWMITDGLGEAGDDLQPGSTFLARLNAQCARASVQYTIIAGDQNMIFPTSAGALDGAANVLPLRISQWWGIRQTESGLQSLAERMRQQTGKSDGPVKLAKRLAGVSDYVVLRRRSQCVVSVGERPTPGSMGCDSKPACALTSLFGGGFVFVKTMPDRSAGSAGCLAQTRWLSAQFSRALRFLV